MSNYDHLPIYIRRRFDPERLDTVVRSTSKKTRCPECDTLNSAGQKYCDRCGAALYPEWNVDRSAVQDDQNLFDLLVEPDESSSYDSEEYQREEGDYVTGYPAVHMPESAVTECPRCHFINPARHNYCGKCGSKLYQDAPQNPQDKTGRETVSKDTDRPAYYK